VSHFSAVGGARAILKAATDLFANTGYDSASLAEIANRAGVCKANIFHHFASKESLYLEVVKAASRADEEYAKTLLGESCPVTEKLRRLARFRLQYMLDHRSESLLACREMSDDGRSSVRHLARDVLQRNFRLLMALFEQGRSSGEFREDIDPAVTSLTLVAAQDFYFRFHGTLGEFDETRHCADPVRYADAIVDLMLDGISAPRAACTVRSKRRRRASVPL